MIHAQEPDSGWEIIERCASEPTTPPDDWTFEGTILATGWAGIHGINADLDTPQVLALNDRWIDGDGGFGTLSPDGQWFAVAQGRIRRDDEYILGGYSDIENLIFYNLTDRENVRQLPWEETFELFYGSAYSQYDTFRTPVWYDNETVVYQKEEQFYFIHILDLIVEEWVEPHLWDGVSPVQVVISFPSPDWSRIVTRSGSYAVFDTASREHLNSTYRTLASIDGATVAWHPDSNEFIVSGAQSVAIYDADANLLDTIASGSDLGDRINTNNIVFNENAYAPDGELFWVRLRTNNSEMRLAIGSRSERTIIDTCVDAGDVSFSPDGQFIALWEATSSQQNQLLIFDLNSWQLFKTGIYHDGRIVGWREDS